MGAIRIGISRPSWQETDNSLIFRKASELGFYGIQIKPHQYNAVGLDPRKFTETYGELSYLARGGLIVYPGPIYRNWPDKLQAYIAFASALGAEQLCICAYIQQKDLDEAGLAGVAETLNQLGREAVKGGVTLSIHNHKDTVFETIEDLQTLFEHVDVNVCGLTFDTAHGAKGGIHDLADAVQQFHPFINNVHLKDLSADGRFCPLGTGTLDLAPVIRKLHENGYDNWLIVDEESEGLSVEESFELSVQFLSKHGLMKGGC